MDSTKKLKDVLSSLETIREDVMVRINEMGGNEQAILPSIVYPVANATPLNINDFPVFKIRYEGMLPVYNDSDREYQRKVRQYYLNATFQAYDFKKSGIKFKDAVIFIRHAFNNLAIRDLDNRNRKYLIDALRLTQIIADDNWKNLSIYEEGTWSANDNYVEVYILDSSNFLEFMNYIALTNPKILANNNRIEEEKTSYVKKENKSIAAVKKKF